jgi:iron complex transport system substrate-binding protein
MVCVSGCASMGVKEEDDSSETNPAIASTSVAICEILDSLDYENVVGVPETTSDKMPERYKNVETIGAPMTPDYEIIKDISPDLVLSPKTLESSLSADYATAGINSAFLDLSSVEGMYDAITSLGDLLGRKEQAKKLVDDYNDYMDSYSVSNEDAKSILLLMSFPDGFYLVATENSYVGNLVKLAGGKNVYGTDTNGDENGFVTINPEDMVQKDPDLILMFAHYNEDSAFEYMKEEFKTNSAWQYYDAVKNEDIYYLPSEYFGMSATLEWTDALDYLKPILYGE